MPKKILGLQKVDLGKIHLHLYRMSSFSFEGFRSKTVNANRVTLDLHLKMICIKLSASLGVDNRQV